MLLVKKTHPFVEDGIIMKEGPDPQCGKASPY